MVQRIVINPGKVSVLITHLLMISLTILLLVSPISVLPFQSKTNHQVGKGSNDLYCFYDIGRYVTKKLMSFHYIITPITLLKVLMSRSQLKNKSASNYHDGKMSILVLIVGIGERSHDLLLFLRNY